MTRTRRFVDAFWGTDYLSTQGFDNIVSRLQDGRKMCKDVMDFIKNRAKIEEDYAKSLLNLAKKAGGATEHGTLRDSWETLRCKTEQTAQLHTDMQQALLDQVTRLNQLSEQQKEKRKTVEDGVKKQQTLKNNMYKKTMDLKRTYEMKCQEYEKAQKAFDTPQTQQKELEKNRVKKDKAKIAADQADAAYHSSVQSLENARQQWEKEMEKACEEFQCLEEERIQHLRNELWIHTNISSQTCVDIDELNEEVRKSLEKCDIDEDIRKFIDEKNTGSERPASIKYESFNATQSGGRQTLSRRPPEPLPSDRGKTMPGQRFPAPQHTTQTMPATGPAFYLPNDFGDGAYASVNDVDVQRTGKKYKVVQRYTAKTSEELTVTEDEIIVILNQDGFFYNVQVVNSPRKGRIPAHVVSDFEITYL